MSGPSDARIVELLPLEDEDIVRFAEAMKGSVPGLDGWEFAQRLKSYPDLARLARIPLFLAMLIASDKATCKACLRAAPT